jgi:hypothetical protein
MVVELFYAGRVHIGNAFVQVWWVLPLQLLVPKQAFKFLVAFVLWRPVILFLQEFFDGGSAISRVFRPLFGFFVFS